MGTGEVSLESDGTAYCHKALLNVFCNVHKGFKIVHFNARSLGGLKLDHVRHVFSDLGVDVLCVSETWFNSAVPDSIYAISNYNLFRNDRDGKRGGGVAIYVRDGLNAKIVSLSRETQVEFITVSILGNTKILISCVYNPHRSACIDPFFTDISGRLIDYDFYIVCGDFNINLMTDNTLCQSFKNHISSTGLELVNKDVPTRFSVGSTPSLLDIVAVSDLSLVVKFDQMSFVSDHDLVFCSFDIDVTSIATLTHYSFRDFKEINMDELQNDIMAVDWSECWSFVSVNDKLNWFMTIIGDVFDRHVVIKTISPCSNRIPWFNKEVQTAIRCRNKMHSRWKRNPCEARWLEFIRIRNRTNQIIRRAKCTYFAHKLNTDLSTKQLWKNIRKLRVFIKEDSPCPIDPNIMNAHFNALASTAVAPKPMLRMSCAMESPFEFSAISESDIIHHTVSISSNAVGFDGLPIRFIKLILPFIVPTLTHILNHCITTSQFPDQWKIATVTPIAKSPRASVANDFRPIAILPALAKVFEKIIAEQINGYIQTKRLLSPLQSGFRTGHSCNTAIMKVLDDIRIPFDNNCVTMLCLLDFSKAFDTINHDLLCNKLAYFYNLSGSAVSLISNYLCNRLQRVSVQGRHSELTKVSLGVPQGSILGPLLFALFLNDIFNLDVTSTMHAYADDIQLYNSNDLTNMVVLAETLNADLKMISTWCAENGLMLNVSKCQVLPISFKNVISSSLPVIYINDQPISIVPVVKNLGYWINRNLSCSDHVNKVVCKVYGILRILRLSCAFTPVNIKCHLVLQLIMPHINYFCTVYSKLDSVSARKIVLLFNNIVRYVFCLRRFDHVSHLSTSLLGVDILTYIDMRNILFLHRLMYLSMPCYLFNKVLHCRSARLHQLLIQKYRHLNSSRLFFVNAVRLWNSLPTALRLIPRPSDFKKALCAHYQSPSIPNQSPTFFL